MAEEVSAGTDIDDLHPVLIVVGACLRGEVADRPLAYKLQKRVRRWLTQHDAELEVAIDPLVCSDVWYLNSEALQAFPTISIGGPGVNSLAAYLAQDVEDEVSSDEEQAVIQIDPEFTDLRVSIWGTDHRLTSKGLDVFSRRYLDSYLRAVATQIEPREDE